MWNSLTLQFVLIAPALALSSALPPTRSPVSPERWAEDTTASFDSSYAVLDVKVPHDLAIPNDQLSFQLHVLKSIQSCGFGNITFDGQELPQDLTGSVFVGSGSLITTQNHTVGASWRFDCIRAEGRRDTQLLTFSVDSVNGNSVQNTGFSVGFIQTGNPRIIDPLSDPYTADFMDTEDSHEPTLDDDLAELDFMHAQLEELQYLIREKDLAIARRRNQCHNFITTGRSFNCVAQTISGKAQNAAHGVIETVKGSYHREGSGNFRWRTRPPVQDKTPVTHETEERGQFRWRARPPVEDKTPVNREREGSGSFRWRTRPPVQDGAPENHIHPRPLPPHFRRLRLPLPVCRYPPPPHRPSNERKPYSGRPENGPSNSDYRLAPQYSRPAQDNTYNGLPSTGHRNLRFENARVTVQPGRQGFKAVHVLCIGLSVFALTLALQSLWHRHFTPSEEATARENRRAVRQSRRSLRHAARTEALNNFLARVGLQIAISHTDTELQEEETEKHSDLDGSSSNTMTDDLAELMNAADMVTDIIAAEEGRSRMRPSVPVDPCPTGRRSAYAGDMESEEEPLPAYEDRDSSEMGSVADGCRYTPGSLDYTPSQAGSGSEYLGAEGKD